MLRQDKTLACRYHRKDSSLNEVYLIDFELHHEGVYITGVRRER